MTKTPAILLACSTCIFAPVAALAQRITFGAVGGTNLTSNFAGRDIATPADALGNPANHFQFLSGPNSFIVGGLLEFQLSEAFSVEANILWRPLKSTIIFTEFPAAGSPAVSKENMTSVQTWEFPVLAKYSLPLPLISNRFRPFVEAGPSFRTQQNAGATQPSQFGISGGAGLAIQLGRIRVSPTIRYTRWKGESIYPRYATKPDQIEFLTSVAYSADLASGTRTLFQRRVDFGVLAGLPTSDGFATSYEGYHITERPRYLVGAAVEINVLRKLSVEADGIYKPLRASQTADGQQRFSVITWQFPVLAKYRFTRSKWTPFAEIGPSFRLSGNLNGYNPSSYGVTAGTGVDLRLRKAKLSPTFRYTRWAADQTLSNYRAASNYRTNANTIEFLVSALF